MFQFAEATTLLDEATYVSNSISYTSSTYVSACHEARSQGDSFPGTSIVGAAPIYSIGVTFPSISPSPILPLITQHMALSYAFLGLRVKKIDGHAQQYRDAVNSDKDLLRGAILDEVSEEEDNGVASGSSEVGSWHILICIYSPVIMMIRSNLLRCPPTKL